jgi:hypothetical protein
MKIETTTEILIENAIANGINRGAEERKISYNESQTDDVVYRYWRDIMLEKP